MMQKKPPKPQFRLLFLPICFIVSVCLFVCLFARISVEPHTLTKKMQIYNVHKYGFQKYFFFHHCGVCYCKCIYFKMQKQQSSLCCYCAQWSVTMPFLVIKFLKITIIKITMQLILNYIRVCEFSCTVMYIMMIVFHFFSPYLCSSGTSSCSF